MASRVQSGIVLRGMLLASCIRGGVLNSAKISLFLKNNLYMSNETMKLGDFLNPSCFDIACMGAMELICFRQVFEVIGIINAPSLFSALVSLGSESSV